MERITVPGHREGWEIPAGREGDAAARLASFENAWERLLTRQGEIAARMEDLKARGKQKSAQFRELFGEKLIIQNTLTLWETYGVK